MKDPKLPEVVGKAFGIDFPAPKPRIAHSAAIAAVLGSLAFATSSAVQAVLRSPRFEPLRPQAQEHHVTFVQELSLDESARSSTELIRTTSQSLQHLQSLLQTRKDEFQQLQKTSAEVSQIPAEEMRTLLAQCDSLIGRTEVFLRTLQEFENPTLSGSSDLAAMNLLIRQGNEAVNTVDSLSHLIHDFEEYREMVKKAGVRYERDIFSEKILSLILSIISLILAFFAKLKKNLDDHDAAYESAAFDNMVRLGYEYIFNRPDPSYGDYNGSSYWQKKKKD